MFERVPQRGVRVPDYLSGGLLGRYPVCRSRSTPDSSPGDVYREDSPRESPEVRSQMPKVLEPFQMRVVEAPPNNQKQSKIRSILDFVDAHEGQWCEVSEYPRIQSASTCASYWQQKFGDYEFIARSVKTNGKRGKARVYCRRVKGKK